jgi:EpsI family protein
MLLIAQSAGETGILQIHRPEICYPAGGYHLSPVVTENIDLGGKLLPTNRLTASADGQSEHILYWTRIGDELPTSWRAQRITIAEENLRGIIPDAVLVRLSVRSNDAPAAFKTMEDFVRAMVAALPPERRRILIA